MQANEPSELLLNRFTVEQKTSTNLALRRLSSLQMESSRSSNQPSNAFVRCCTASWPREKTLQVIGLNTATPNIIDTISKALYLYKTKQLNPNQDSWDVCDQL